MISFIRNNYKSIIKFVILFFFFFLFLVVNYNIYQGDSVANYGFSYALLRGEVPYLDFNMVIPLFSPFLYSLGLHLFNDILMFYIEQSILLCALVYFLEKLVGKKYILFILGICMFYPISLCTTIFPGYNFIVFLLLIILFYLLKNKKNDILVGFILGLIFCTKQTIGLVLFIPSLYYLFSKKDRFFKRLIGYLIPIVITFIYLAITGSFMKFIDLCFLGLFNFGSNNKSISMFYFILLFVGVIYLVYRIIKNRNDYELYYLLLYSVISLPIVDFYHVSLFLIGILYLICRDISIRDNIYKYLVVMIVFLFISSCVIEYKFLNSFNFYNYKHFTFYLKTPKYNENIKSINKFTKKYDNVYYLLRGTESFFFKISNDRDITYYDLLNYGNFGYRGEEKIVSRINNIPKNSIIVTDSSLCSKSSNNNQFICESLLVLKSSKLIKNISNYRIYIKE